MKKLTFILFSLFLIIGVQGQSLMTSIVADQGVTTTGGGGYCTEYQAVYDAQTTKPVTYDADYNAYVVAGKAHGWWAKGDILYVMCQETNSGGEALLDWYHPTGSFNLTNVGSTTFTALEGFTGSGTTSTYLNTGWQANVDAVHATLDATTLACYMRLDKDEEGVAIGLLTYGSNFIGLQPRYSGSFGGVVNQSAWFSTKTVANSQGCFVLSRENSTTLSFFKGGVDLGDATVSSTAVPIGRDVTLLYMDGNSSWSSSNQISVVWIGGLLTDTEKNYFNSDTETLMDALGKRVQ